MAKISVVVPIYNTEKYLSACLDSLLEQTVKDIEILAVNNGSTDSCERIILSFAAKDPRVKLIGRLHGEVGEARNDALEVASGDYIAFCDSDDTVPPNAYELLLSAGERSDCDVVVGDHFNVDDLGRRDRVHLLPQARSSDFQRVFFTPCVWNKLIRRSFLERNKLRFPSLIMGEDVLFLANLLNARPKITQIPDPVYLHWHHTQALTPSMIHRYTLDFFKLHLLCRQELLSAMANTSYQKECEEYVYFGMTGFLCEFLMRIWKCEEREEAFELLRTHVLTFDWTKAKKQFQHIFQVPLEIFREISARAYMTQIVDFDHHNFIVREYEAGLIGFRYILRCMRAWFYYKLMRRRKTL